MLPPHDGAAGITVHGISRAVDRNCYPVEPKVVVHTGCLSLERRFLILSDCHGERGSKEW